MGGRRKRQGGPPGRDRRARGEGTAESRRETHAVPERWRLGASFVPKGRYVDADFLRLEYERLFPSVWQMACREEEVAEPGCFCEYRIGRDSVLVVRQRDGAIRAFHNACRHRGMQVARGAGRVEEFRCPFHGWRYALDGTNTFVFMPEEFAARAPHCNDLSPVHVATWAGWVFIHMGEHPEPLAEWLAPVGARLQPFDIGEMRYAWRKSIALPANWKTVIDAFIEGYHTAGTHPQTFLPDRAERPATVEEYGLAPYMPTFIVGDHSWCGGGRRPDLEASGQSYKRSRDDAEGLARSIEYLVENVRSQKTERDARAARSLVGRDLGGKRPIAAFHETREKLAREEGVISYPSMSFAEFARGAGAWHLFPTMVVLPDTSSVLGYRMRPDGDDPDRCIWDVYSLEHFPSGRIPETRWERFADWREAGLPSLLVQDMRNLGGVQSGLHSRGFDGLWLNVRQETSVLHHHQVADRYIFGVDRTPDDLIQV